MTFTEFSIIFRYYQKNFVENFSGPESGTKKKRGWKVRRGWILADVKISLHLRRAKGMVPQRLVPPDKTRKESALPNGRTFYFQPP